MTRRTLRLTLLLLLGLMMVVPAQARKKPNYEITLKIDKGPDTMILLGHYYGRGNQVLDTAYRDKKGRFVFTSYEDTLPQGLFFFANSKGHYVDFVVYGERPFFDFETEQRDWTSCMKVKGSKENAFFFAFHREEGVIVEEMDRQRMLMDSATYAPFYRQQMKRLDSLRIAYAEREPDRFLSRMMLATKEVLPPLVSPQGDTLTEQQRRDYYIGHYFDNMPLEDNAIVNTPRPVFYDRVMGYFDNVLRYAPPQTLIQYMDPVLDRAKKAPNVFQYLLVNLVQKYLQSKVMVYDEVYVHLVQKYYASEDNWWTSPSSIDKESQRAAKWERLLVGKEAPELILFDTLRVPHSLHAMPYKWKLLIFWSPNCGHCQHIIPEVYRIFEKYQQEYNMVAYTILSDPDDKTRKEWKEFMKEHGMNSPNWLSLDGGEANVDWHDVYDIQSTPQIYLLDENNIIQAKKLGETSLENILTAICGTQH